MGEMLSRQRFATTALSFAAVAAIGLGGAFMGAPAQAEEGEACTTTKFSSSKVEKACRDGGRAGAKTYMKAVLKKGKAAGEELSCKTCHSSLKTFALAPGAADNLERIEAL